MDLNNILSKVSKEFLVSFVANSISFESVPVSEDVVLKIVDGDTSGIEKKTIQVIENYVNGFDLALSILDRGTFLTEDDLKDIHDKVVSGFSLGGLYRNVDISIKGSNHTPPSYVKVYDRMKKYFDTINDSSNEKIYNVAFSHAQLMKIHPFLDGNGRVARIVLNYMLLKNGYKPVIISYIESDKYFDVLEKFKVEKDINPLIDFILEKQK